jgi:hypothetical protein
LILEFDVGGCVIAEPELIVEVEVEMEVGVEVEVEDEVEVEGGMATRALGIWSAVFSEAGL